MDVTKIYTKEEFNDALAIDVLKKVKDILEEKGYNSINQIVGYLISGDLGYITNYKKARDLISEYDRTKLLEIILRNVI